MKKLSFFLMAMLFSVMSFAAESLLVTLDFSKNTWGLPVGSANKTTATVNYTNGDYTITLAGGGSGHYYNNDGYLIFGKSGATLTLPAFDFKTTKIVVTGRTGASASVLQNIYVGATAVSTQTKGAAVTNTYAIAEDYQAAGNVYVLKVTSSHNTQIVKMEIYGEEGGEQGEKVDAPTFSVTETNFNKAFDLTISSAEGTTLKYTTDNTDPKTSETAVSVETNTANVAIPAKSTVVNAVAVKGDLVSVTSSIVYAYVNSAETAYTVAEAMEVIDAGLGLENELYVKGEISKIEKFDANYGSITYWIEDEEGNEFECYSGLGLNKAKFTSKEDVEVGASVVACGVMKLFVKSSGDKIYEFNYNNYLVEYVAPVVNHTITVSANPAEAGTVTGAGEYEEGATATLTATANEGYEFVNWTENEVEVSTDAEYTFEVLADRALVANFKEAEPVYQVIEDEITNFVFDTESWPMVCSGGPSANYQIVVFLVLTEAADGTLSYEDCSVSINGTDATFIEGTLFDLDVYAPSADAVLRVQWNGEFYELHLAMSAAAAEPIVVVVENATLDDKVESTGFFYMAGECTIDGVIYPVKAEIPGFDKTKAEAEYENVMVEVGTWGGEYLGNATGTATVSVVDNVVTLSGVIENPMTHVAFDVTISGTLPVVEPTTITYELNGGEFPAVVVPTNAELWEAFKPYYNTYYGLERADQPITAVASFASAKMQEIMTDPESEYKWLGDYVLSVAAEQGVTVDSELTWRFSVHTFFNAEKRTAYPSNVPDFTEAGKPENWGPAYQAAHEVVLPTEPVAEDYVLPTPVKEGYTFVGWYDNADGEGEAMTVLPAGWAGTLYAIWEVEGPATALENIAVEGKAVKAIVNGQLIIIKNGVQYNAQGQVVK